MITISRFFYFLLFLLFLSISGMIFADNEAVTFDSGEHIYIGNSAILYYPVKVGDHYQYENIEGGKVDLREWIMPDLKASLSFGKVVALPDLLADSKRPISDGKTVTDRRERFNQSFNVFIITKPQTLDKIYSIMQEEMDMIKAALDKGEQPSEAYAKYDARFVEEYFLAYPKCAALLLSGWDHFGKYARLAYQAGHAEAIDMAIKANQVVTDEAKKRKLLALAYAKEAYADHFLTDSFAAGHMRTPDKEIAAVMSPDIAPQAVAMLIALQMHNEDNIYGLHVTNAQGDHWIAYGDTRYFDAVNLQNKKIIEAALQISVDEVILAFKTGQVIPADKYRAFSLLSDLQLLDDYKHYLDSRDKIVPMFAYDVSRNGVLRRKDLNALHPSTLPFSDDAMLNHGAHGGWNGLVTLLELKLKYHPQMVSAVDDKGLETLLTSTGELNAEGLYLLSKLLSPVERTLFCADKHLGKILNNYLQC